MRRVFLAIALVLWAAVPAQAAISVVAGQTAYGFGNDVTITFPNPWSAGNQIVIVTVLGSTAQTTSITGVSETVSHLAGPIDNAGPSLRADAYCFVGDASDDADFIGFTSGGGNVMVVAVEIMGGTCTEDNVESTLSATTSPYSLPITTTIDGSFVLAMCKASNASNYTATTGTDDIPSDGADIGGGNDVGSGLGQYFVAGAAGSQPVGYTSTANETSLCLAVAVQAAPVSSGGMLLRGIGG